ncbi:MAG: helix-turn-helix transcriptional regulator [Egibacteraceae bacterium]
MQARLERLINLVIALRETRRPLQAVEIRRSVAGYGQPDAEAFRRMFERDKADLRDMGVPVETVPIGRFDDRLGYRIDPHRYDLPELRLEPAELTALALAIEVTGLRDEASSGLLKLAVDAGDPDSARAVQAVPVAIPLEAPHRGMLMEAQLARQVVRFAYARPGQPADQRTVDPHALVYRRGRWYLVGRDHGRDAQRVFRLDRITGGVRTVGEPGAFDPPDVRIGPDDVVPPTAKGAPETAEVLASPEIAWEVARSARGSGGAATDEGWTAFTMAVGDPERFVGWALSCGPELEVLGPPQLRAAVIARLERLAGS